MKFLALFTSVLTLLFVACSPAEHSNSAPLPQSPVAKNSVNQNRSSGCINVNKASAEELKALQGVGEVLAQKIIDYRNQHGSFRRPQELIIIEGFSEKKYRAIAAQICVD